MCWQFDMMTHEADGMQEVVAAARATPSLHPLARAHATPGRKAREGYGRGRGGTWCYWLLLMTYLTLTLVRDTCD